jgi:predicted Zn-dependent peptidase
MGVSHFLEHMMFKGTARRSADDVNREFDELGAVYNAFTSQEMTAFWAHVIPESLAPALDILSDIMRPALREEDFNTERGVILEEIAMYQDMPFWRLYESTLEKYFGAHPLSHRVLGTNETITNLQRDVMQAYFEDRYSSDNTTCVLAGAIDFERTVEAIEKQCGYWKKTGTKRQYPECVPNGSTIDFEDATTNRHYLLMVTPGPAIADDQRYAAAMLGGALGDDEGSLLDWALVDPGIAEEAQVGYDGRDGLGEFYVFASCPPERATQVEETINDQIAGCKELITAEDLERLKHKMATQVTIAGERPAGRMKRLGRFLTDIGEYKTLEEELARIEAVSLEDVRDVFDAYGFEPRAVGRLHPPVGAGGEA